jgi:hypothetical protein
MRSGKGRGRGFWFLVSGFCLLTSGF